MLPIRPPYAGGANTALDTSGSARPVLFTVPSSEFSLMPFSFPVDSRNRVRLAPTWRAGIGVG